MDYDQVTGKTFANPDSLTSHNNSIPISHMRKLKHHEGSVTSPGKSASWCWTSLAAKSGSSQLHYDVSLLYQCLRDRSQRALNARWRNPCSVLYAKRNN